MRPTTKKFLLQFWRSWLLIVWAACWGGLSFYAIVVVPIGTDLHGSVEQGFVTQQVTWWHNWLLLLFVVCLMIEATIFTSRNLWIAALILLGVNLALFIDHSYLTRQMDFDNQSVQSEFYSQHAVYLWLTAIEWFVGLAIPFLLVTVELRPQPLKSGK